MSDDRIDDDVARHHSETGETDDVISDQGGAPVRRDSVPRSRLTKVALAAAAVIAVAVSLGRDWVARRSAADVVEYAGALSSHRLPADWADPSWNAMRSESTEVDVARAVRIGARITDLELAAVSSDSALPRVAASLVALASEMPGGTDVAAGYRDASRAMAGQSPDAERQRAAAARALAALAGPSFVATGAWLETTRIAATRHDAAYLHSAAFRRGVDVARAAVRDDVDASAAVEDLRTFSAQPSPNWSVILTTIRSLFLAFS